MAFKRLAFLPSITKTSESRSTFVCSDLALSRRECCILLTRLLRLSGFQVCYNSLIQHKGYRGVTRTNDSSPVCSDLGILCFAFERHRTHALLTHLGPPKSAFKSLLWLQVLLGLVTSPFKLCFIQDMSHKHFTSKDLFKQKYRVLPSSNNLNYNISDCPILQTLPSYSRKPALFGLVVSDLREA